MTGVVTVAEAAAYLAQNGWVKEPDTWRGASIWTFGGHEVLVPARDHMGDSQARMRELIDVLASAEHREPDEVERSITSPLSDAQSFHLHPAGLPPGATTLQHGAQSLRAIRASFRAVVRSVVAGPRTVSAGRAEPSVTNLVDALQLDPSKAGSYVVTVRVPLETTSADGPQPVGPAPSAVAPALPLGRRTTIAMEQSIAALSAAVQEAAIPGSSDEITGLATLAGVADLSSALGGLAGPDRDWPFTVEFRWGHAFPVARPKSSIVFGPGAGRLLREMGTKLRRSPVDTRGSARGVVSGVVDDPSSADRWRIHVEGDVVLAAGASRQSIWVRLRAADEFDRAIDAQRSGRRVRAAGLLQRVGNRLELWADEYETLEAS